MPVRKSNMCGTLFIDGEKLASTNVCLLDFDNEPLFFTQSIFLNQQLDFECNIEAPELSHYLQELALQEAQKPQRFTVSHTVKVPKRRHHKTRIGKKWAKLYGYDLYEDIYEIHDMETVNKTNFISHPENDLFETVFTGTFIERKKIDED